VRIAATGPSGPGSWTPLDSATPATWWLRALAEEWSAG
jgi:hypothetical protein